MNSSHKTLSIISSHVKIVNNPLLNEEPETQTYDSGAIAFIIMCSALVWFMIPGVGFFYSGLLRVENALYIILLTFWSVSVVWIQWFIFGYSLCFSKNASFFIGTFDNLFLKDVGNKPSFANNEIPELLFCLYQGMFAAITPALLVGAVSERIKFLPTTIFIFLWTSLVYDFIACWTWNPNGWSSIMEGSLDFAGGTPIHVSSGSAGLAFSILMGRRNVRNTTPHNMTYVFLGTMMLWFGWFGFNSGSALSPGFQSVNACIVTNLSASIGAFTWVFLAFLQEKKFSPLGFCSGAIAGLVCITPACGYVSPASSLVFGSFGSLVCFISTNLMHLSPIDDSVDLFAVHGVGGIVGCVLTGIFAEKSYAPGIKGGCLDGHCIQIVYQLIDCFAAFAWSFVVTFTLVLVLSLIPGLKLRVPENEEIDLVHMKTSAYEYYETLKQSLRYQIKFSSLWYGSSPTINKEDGPFVIGYYHKFGEAASFDFATQLETFCKGVRKINQQNPSLTKAKNHACECEISLY